MDKMKYMHWSGSRWYAAIADLRQQGGPAPCTIWTLDPDFRHYQSDGSYSHSDKWIQYKTWDGSNWASLTHTHTNCYGWVDFTFEHFRHDNLNDSDHEDRTIRFLDWNGAKRELTVKRFHPPPYQVDLNLTEYRRLTGLSKFMEPALIAFALGTIAGYGIATLIHRK